MDFYTGKKEQYTPPKSITSTEIKEVWNTGMIGWNMIGMSSQVPVTTTATQPGYTTVSYYSNIRLNFLDRAKLVGEVKPEIPPLLWMGEADNESLDTDIRDVSTLLLTHLAGEFPTPSNKGAQRFVRRFIYGGLGLGFLNTDWRVITYVEPNFVAESKGIKPGDILVAVNGRNAFKANTNAPFPKQSGNPYLKFILFNRGDKDVELLVKSYETGRTVSLTMRPRLEDRTVLVDSTGIPLGK